MKCPIDEETLVIADRQGIEIDYCPRCRGIWLDRGEIDKLIDRAGDRYDSEPSRQRDEVSAPYRRDRDDDDDDDDRHRYGHGGKRKKKGFLSEMFEFGG